MDSQPRIRRARGVDRGVILGTSAAWLGCSFIGATDLPMAVAFSAAMLLSLDWIETGQPPPPAAGRRACWA